MATNDFSKVILTTTHNGKRPVGTFLDEARTPECQEVERQLRWVKCGRPYHRELVWKVSYSCGLCKGFIYLNQIKRVAEE